MTTRLELLKHFGIVRDGPHLHPLTIQAMKDYEQEAWAENLESSPHGHPWHTSIHASAYQAGDMACKRKLLYTLLDIPNAEPTNPRLRGQGEMGKAAENLITHRWAKAGMMLGVDVPEFYGQKMAQVGFEVPTLWFTGSVDAILDIRPHWEYVLPVDVKSKDHDIVTSMQVGSRSYDERHFMQLQAYLYLCIYFHNEMGWDKLGLKEAKGGIIYYVSRQDPTHTHEFYIEADGMLMADANAVIGAAKVAFEEDRLPPRPKEWKWSEKPCQYCDFKKFACKPDDKDGITVLSETNGIAFAKTVRDGYDPDETRKKVLERWETQ